MIIGHLNDRMFANWALDPTDAVAVAHLNDCEACRKEAVDFSGKLAAFREALAAASESSTLKWVEPDARQSEPRRESLGLEILIWAPRLVLATLVVALALMSFRPKPVAPPPAAHVDDQALMTQIEEDLSRPAPQALAAAEVSWTDTNQASDTNQKAEH